VTHRRTATSQGRNRHRTTTTQRPDGAILVEVKRDDAAEAGAAGDPHDVRAEATVVDHGSHVDVTLSVVAGHHSPALRADLLDAVFGLDRLRDGTPVSVALPMGDAELLLGVTDRRPLARIHAAGATCLIDAPAEPPAAGVSRQSGGSP
jgi:hypothetical protein